MRIILIVLLLASGIAAAQPRTWINELHYDNIGADSLEFVEVVSSELLNGLRLVGYNGATGSPYDSVLLDTLIYQTFDNHYFQVWYPELLQNGPSDGIALFWEDSLIQALSYEGAFTAIDGPAAGIEFNEIEPEETTYTPRGYSIQMDGKGIRREHFVWKLQDSMTPGRPNSNQEFTTSPVIYTDPADSVSFDITPYGYSSEAALVTVRASNIASPLRAFVSTGFQLDTSQFFSNPKQAGQHINLPATEDFLPPTALFVRFTPPEASGNKVTGLLSLENSEEYSEPVVLQGMEGNIDYPRMWINEFHYDDNGFDTLEFVEIALQHDIRYDLTEIHLLAYNGGNGKAYRDFVLSEMQAFSTPDPAWTLFVTDFPQIQNGPDGLALCYRDSCRQIISYEGEFVATDGQAYGQESKDIGVQEFSDSPEGSSLQLMGTGNHLSDFTWIYVPGHHTRGLPNESQILPIRLLRNDFKRISNSIELSWESISTSDQSGFEVYISSDGVLLDSIGWVDVDPSNYYIFHYDKKQRHYVHVQAVNYTGVNVPLFILSLPGVKTDSWRLTNKGKLHSPIASSAISLKVFSEDGKILLELHDHIEDHAISLDHWLMELDPGMYLLTIESPKSNATLRFHHSPR